MRSTDELIEAARRARARAYAPFSRFSVGAAVETESGEIIEGCNVENASFGLSICAERTALVRAVAQGYRKFRAIAIAGPEGVVTAPCGACRQFIAEFDVEMPVAFTSPDGVVETTLSQLLPYAFSAQALT